MKEMIAYCGLDCEKCDAYLATLHDDAELREKTAKLWTELNGVTILPDRRSDYLKQRGGEGEPEEKGRIRFKWIEMNLEVIV